MTALRVLIVDDHDITRRAIRSFLVSYPELQICGEAADGFEAVDKAKSLRPDVILMDISMPRLNGLEATKLIQKENLNTKVIIVSQNDPAVVGLQAREAGAAGYISKKDIGQQLLPILRGVMDQRAGGPGVVFEFGAPRP